MIDLFLNKETDVCVHEVSVHSRDWGVAAKSIIYQTFKLSIIYLQVIPYSAHQFRSLIKKKKLLEKMLLITLSDFLSETINLHFQLHGNLCIQVQVKDIYIVKTKQKKWSFTALLREFQFISSKPRNNI